MAPAEIPVNDPSAGGEPTLIVAAPPKRSQACDLCRIRKIRCAGGTPCSHCVENDEECVFTARRRRQRKKHDLPTMVRRLAEFEDLLEAVHRSIEAKDEPGRVFDRDASSQQQRQLQPSHAANLPHHPQRTFSQGLEKLRPIVSITDESFQAEDELSKIRRLESTSTSHDISEAIVPASHSQTSSTDVHWPTRDQGLRQSSEASSCQTYSFSDTFGTSNADDEETSGYHADTVHIEYWGRKTSMSICSKAGIAWVKDRVKRQDFQASASLFARDVTNRLKIRRKMSRERKQEPRLADALRYTKAYFEEAPDAALGIVQRPWFEAKLRSFYSNLRQDDEPSWYALRHVIYASGCRIEMSRTSSCYESQKVSWEWFENALSVHSELLFWPTTVVGVQALTLMAYFTEGICCPIIQYMLCSNALRLAYAQGLHRQAPPSWTLPEEEKHLRTCIFWALYCLDKEIACRSGRPSIMEDDEISCEVPTHFVSTSSGYINDTYLQALIRISQLSSLATKRLSSVASFRQTPEEWVNTVQELDAKLAELRQNLQDNLFLTLPIDLSRPPVGVNTRQALTLQFLHHTLVWDIHTSLAHPWFRSILGLERRGGFENEIKKSSAIVVETSRAAILDCRFIHIDANCTLPIGYYAPLYAVVNLFVHILQDPSLASVQSDLSLMDVGAGYFARLEFATDSQLSVPLVKDIALLAHNAVQDFKTAEEIANSSRVDSEGMPVSMTVFATLTSIDDPTVASDRSTEEWLGMDINEDIEMWGVWAPGVGPDNYQPDPFQINELA